MTNRIKNTFLIIISIFLLFTFNYSYTGMLQNVNSGTSFAVNEINSEVFFFKQNADTIVGVARIVAVWTDIQQIKVKLQITQFRDNTFRLSLYNLLGKEVKTIYEGLPKDNDFEYTSSIADIPSGVYICILSSNNYKDAKKIVISR